MGNCNGSTTRRRRSCWPTHDLGGGIGMLLRRRSSCWRRLLLVGIALVLLALLDGSSGAHARRSRFCDYHPNHPACLIEKEQEYVAATDEEQEPQPCLNDFLKGAESASTQLRPPRSFLLLAVAIAVCLSTASMYIWWLKATHADSNNITADENDNQNLATTPTTETATALTSALLSEAPTSAITATTTTTTTTTTTVKGSPAFEEVNITRDTEEQALIHSVSDSDDDADECNNDKRVGAEDVMEKGRKDTSSDEEAESPSSSASFLRSAPGASKFAEDECMLTQELRIVKRRSESVSEGEASTTAGQDIEEETYEEKTVVVCASTKSPPSSTNTQEQRRDKQENMDELSHEQRIEGEDNDSHSRLLVPEEIGDSHLHHNTDEIVKDIMKISTRLGLSKEQVLSLSPTEKLKYSLKCYKLKQRHSLLMEQQRNNKAQEGLITAYHKSSHSQLEEMRRHHAVGESIKLSSSQELHRHNRKKEKLSRQQSKEIRRHHRVQESQLRSERRQQRLQLFEAHQRTLLLRTTWLALFCFVCTWAYFMHFEVGLADVIAHMFDHWDVQRNHFLRLVGASSYGSTRSGRCGWMWAMVGITGEGSCLGFIYELLMTVLFILLTVVGTVLLIWRSKIGYVALFVSAMAFGVSVLRAGFFFSIVLLFQYFVLQLLWQCMKAAGLHKKDPTKPLNKKRKAKKKSKQRTKEEEERTEGVTPEQLDEKEASRKKKPSKGKNKKEDKTSSFNRLIGKRRWILNAWEWLCYPMFALVAATFGYCTFLSDPLNPFSLDNWLLDSFILHHLSSFRWPVFS